jgi:hypothetical protein
MTADQISHQWRGAFGATPPLGYRCRAEHAARWLRIHSLPASKRYPSAGSAGDAERSELCRRHNAVATAVLGTAVDCLLFVARHSLRADGAAVVSPARDATGPLAPAVSGLHFSHLPALALVGDGNRNGDSAGVTTHFFAAHTTWSAGQHDALILAVAEEATAHLLWANLHRGTAYAPYDGGADVFFASPEAVAAAKIEWRAWLSARADGL